MNFEELKRLNSENINLGQNLNISPDVIFYIRGDAKLVIEDGVRIDRGTLIEVYESAKVVIMTNVKIGRNCYISAMCGVIIGEGAVISNMVDLHDHIHNTRDLEKLQNLEQDSNESVFSMAPIIVENGVEVANKCTITAGVRIGQNSLIGSNSVVTKSVQPNCVSAGVPNRVIKTFLGKTSNFKYPNITKIAFFGTSLTEHLEAYTPAIYEQMELPEVNSYTLVKEWRKRGFVSILENRIMASKPHLNVEVYNYGKGGANSFEVIEEIKKKTSKGQMFDLSFLECGANDVLRKFQNRLDEAVDIDTFRNNYRNAIELLVSKSRFVACLSMTTVNTELKEDMNREILVYNKEMKKLSQEYSCLFIDNFTEFSNVYQKMKSESRFKLWSDKLHLSELGDTIIANLIFNELEKSNLLDSLYTLPQLDKEKSMQRYINIIS